MRALWMILVLSCLISACGDSKSPESLDGPLDPQRAYFPFSSEMFAPFSIREVEQAGEPRLGPWTTSLLGASVTTDGDLAYVAGKHLWRFDVVTASTTLASPGGAELCPGGFVDTAFVRPGSGSLIHTCSKPGTDCCETYENGVPRPGCPKGQDLLAMGATGALLCEDVVIDAEGREHPHHLDLRAHRIDDDSGFRVVARTPDRDQHFALRADGSIELLGAYPPLPEIDGARTNSLAGVDSSGSSALLADGTFYQRVVIALIERPREWVVSRPGDPEARSLEFRALDPLASGRMVTSR